VVPLLVDERRLAAGLDSALTALAAQAPRDLLTPASLLERLTGHHVFSDRERRALVRRIALTRDGLDLPHHVRMAPSFAARVVAAIDTGHEGTPLDPLIEQYTTLLAFSDMLDVQTALKRALAGERRALDIALLAVDAVLVADDDGAFAWRRLCAAAGIPLEIVDLGPIEPLAIDRIALRGITAMLAFAASGSDGDARRAILSRIAGIGLDDARAMLTAAGERSTLLETIDATKVLLGPRARRDAGAFARGLRAIARAYAAPDAGAATVLGALGAAFTIADAPTAVALASVAQAFDRARSIGPQWTATELIAEIDAEFADARLPVQPAPMVEPLTVVAPLAATPVPQRQRHFSASSLNAYAECARKWYFRYVCAAVEDRGSSASFYGTAFHAALEDFHLRYPRVQETPQSDLATALDAMVIGAFDRYRGRFDAPVEFELQRRRARRTAKRYLHWLIERAQRAPFTVIGCETATDLDECRGVPA
jgi:hypothetical protein